MALIIEDGTIVANANSYNTVAEITAYVELRGYTAAATLESDAVRMYDYMSALSWIVDQTVAYTVTAKHKAAHAEGSYRISQGLDPSVAPSGRVKSEKVGSLATEFFSSDGGLTGDNFLDYMPQAKALLKDLIASLPTTMERN
tara:strand:+ start:12129 stop:12557 length:429 start_codon:yes stop_codon:yes gene_type:complete